MQILKEISIAALLVLGTGTVIWFMVMLAVVIN